MSADPTRLDPPVALTVRVLPDSYGMLRLLRRLAALHGRPAGVPIIGSAPSPDHVAATHRLYASRTVRILVTHVDVDGRLTFALENPR